MRLVLGPGNVEGGGPEEILNAVPRDIPLLIVMQRGERVVRPRLLSQRRQRRLDGQAEAWPRCYP